MKADRVVVLLSTPLTRIDGGVFLSERAHAQTLEILSERFRDVVVVARCRRTPVLAAPEHIAVEATGARLGFELPDYGSSRPLLRAVGFLLSRRVRRALQVLVHPASLLYVESPSLESVLAWSVTRGTRIPYVIEMRGDTVLNSDYMRARLGPAGAVVSRMLSSFYGAYRRQAAGAVFVGEELRHRYQLPHAPTVAVSSVRLPPQCPRPARRVADRARRFLYVGHLEKVKAIHVILEAFARVAPDLAEDWRLDLVGDGPERDALEARARALGIAGHLHFHRRIAWGDALFRFYETADMLLMASLTEGNSRTLLEAMAFGLPAVSSAVGEAPRLLPRDAVVAPGDVEALARAIRAIANSAQRLQELSQHHVEAAKAFTPAELRRRRERFFDDLLGLRGADLRPVLTA